MSSLLIPPEIYFSDFAFDLKCYSVIRNGIATSQYSGLDNTEDRKSYVHFQLPCDIKVGDSLECNGDCFIVTKVDFDTFDGQKALLKAFITQKI